jgi:diadenosine tetraphosphate (Ap4A) HIT family hydrolase
MTRDFLGQVWTYTCMGCAIADGSLRPPGGFIKTGTYFCVHQDPLIPLPGFLVIGARRHIRTLAEMGADEYAEFAALLRETESAIRAVTGVEHLTLVQEEHSVHFHHWFFPWTAAVMAHYGLPDLAKIRVIMAELRREPLSAEEWTLLAVSIEQIKARLAG